MEVIFLSWRQILDSILSFKRIDSQIVVSDKSGDKLAVEQVVRRVDGPYAVVGVVGGAHAEAEGARRPEGRCPPVVVVVTVAVHALRLAELF